MMGVNKVILIGNLGKDPEVRTTQAGDPICNMSVATNESWTDKATGERKTRTEWHRVVIFNPKLAEVAEKYLRKGSSVYLEGELRTRKWTDQSGVEKYSTEVVLGQLRAQLVLLGDGDGQGASGAPAQRWDTPSAGAGSRGGGGRAAVHAHGPRTGPGFGGNDLDDEIPF